MTARNTRSMFKMFAQGAAALTLLLLASAASAQECQADADCGDGYRCELYGGDTAVCIGTPEGEEICEEGDPAELIGYCVREPIPCTSDADCGAGLKCYLTNETDRDDAPPCVDGEDCEAADPIPPGENNSGLVAPEGYCGWAFIDCTADADCGEFGECVSVGGSDCGGAAPFPGCAEGEDCPEPEPVDCGEPEELFACVPAEIECETDDQCPTDWACVDFTTGYCEGSDGGAPVDPDEGSSGDREEPVDDQGDEPNCFEETVRRCAPPGLDYGVDIAGDGTGAPRELDGEPEAPAQNDGDSDSAGGGDGDTDEDAGGCSVSGAQHSSQGGLLATLLLGLVAFAARRRS